MAVASRVCDDAAIRRAWLDTVVTESQRVAGRSLLIDRDEYKALLVQFAQALPEPKSHIETVLMRGLLLDVAYRCGVAMHERVHGRRRECQFQSTTCLESFWSAGDHDPREAFVEWADRVCAELEKVHPLSVSYRVSLLLRRDLRTRWSLEALADRFNVTASYLRREFTREFGMSIQEFRELSRVAASFDELRHEKIDAIAMQVGYRSKKNFYRAFTKLTGLKPQEFRKLSEEKAGDLEGAARLRLVRGQRWHHS